MRLRKVKDAMERLNANINFINAPYRCKGNWQNYFENNNPIHIEVGMGKGQFLKTLASTSSDLNYIGIEKYESVLVKSLINIPNECIPNLCILREDMKNGQEVFEKGEIQRVYLNFSDPWPKERHSKRRLTHRTYLELYKKILEPRGEIYFKTDNAGLYDFTVNELITSQWDIQCNITNLHEKGVGEVVTEYEENFMRQGLPIYKIIAVRPN